jgi:hypothetical protein
MLEKEKTLEQTSKKIEKFLSFIKDVSRFYRLSYKDLLLIRENLSLIPENLILSIGDLEKTIQKSEKSYRLGNYHYRQRYPNSCAIACYMMASSNYLKEQSLPNRKMERDLLKNFNNNISITKLLQLCLSENLHVKVFTELDYREMKFDEERAEILREDFISFYDKCYGARQIEFNFNQPLEGNLLKDLLMNGESILVNGLVDDIPHMRVITGYEGDNFLVSDPLEYKKHQMAFSNLSEISTPPLGQFFFSLTSKEINGE